MTDSGSTLQNSAILRLMSGAERLRRVRQTMMSGLMPISRSSLTLCWVGLVLSSPEASM